MPHINQMRTSLGQEMVDQLDCSFEGLVSEGIERCWRMVLGVELDPSRIYVYPPAQSESMPVDVMLTIHAWSVPELVERKDEVKAWLDSYMRGACLTEVKIKPIRINLILV